MSDLLGPIAFFENFAQIAVLMIAWVIVLLAFFILAVQLFITILEFKLTTLAGFVLVPFALWNKSAFLAERVLGNVISAGIKLMVLAVILGIGSTLFGAFADSFAGGDITIEQALATVLGALSLFMLGIFGPGIAAGIVSGRPQLGAGAVAGSAAGLALGGAAATGAAVGGARALGVGLGTATRAAASVAGGATAAYGLDAQRPPQPVSLAHQGSLRVWLVWLAPELGPSLAASAKLESGATSGLRESYRSGQQAAVAATGGKASTNDASVTNTTAAGSGAPGWAQRLRREQRLREGVTVAAHAVRDGDRPVSGEAPKLRESE